MVVLFVSDIAYFVTHLYIDIADMNIELRYYVFAPLLALLVSSVEGHDTCPKCISKIMVISEFLVSNFRF